MSGTGKALRVGILRLRCQEPQRYYIALQSPPNGSNLATGKIRRNSSRYEQATRTETSEPSRNPDFACSSFIVRLPLPLASLPPEQPLLRLDLFSAPGLESTGIGGDTGTHPGTLVASSLVSCDSLGQEATTRLLQGQRMTLTVALEVLSPEESEEGVGGANGRGMVWRSVSGRAGLAPHELLVELELLDANEAAGEAAGGGGPSLEALEVLVQECLAKQAAVSKVAGQLDATVLRAEELSWRLVDAEKRTRSLLEDNTRLQQLLHAEQEAWRIPQLRHLVDSTMLTRDELIERCESVMVAYGRERARNGELVERLKLLHSEQVDSLELKKRYQQLQEAHEEQARAYTDLEEQANKMSQLRATVKTQEEIIRNLEVLLAQAVQKAKPRVLTPVPDGVASATDAEAAAATAPGDVGDGATPRDLGEQLAEAEQLVLQLQEELAAQQAAAQEREQEMKRMEVELEALRQHTVTEFPVISEAAAAVEARKAAEAAEAPKVADGAAEALKVAEAAAVTEAPEAAEALKVAEAAKAADAAEAPKVADGAAEALKLTEADGVTEAPEAAEALKVAEAAKAETPEAAEAAETLMALEGFGQDRPGTSTGRRPASCGEGGGDGGRIQHEDARDQPEEAASPPDKGEEQQQRHQQDEGVGAVPGPDIKVQRAAAEEDKGMQMEPAAGAEELLEQLQERLQQLEGELEAARQRIKELADGNEAGSKEAAAEEMRKLQVEVAQLTEEKTAAQLRAEYAEGAADAAQGELVEVTRKYAREIAALKTRLAEKEAAMMGGFGGLDQLSSRSEPPYPAFPDKTGPAAANSGGASGVRAVPDPRDSPIPPAAPGVEASGIQRSGLNRHVSLAQRQGTESAVGHAQQGQGEQAAGPSAPEPIVRGPWPLAWMRSRRGRMNSKAALQKGDEG